MVANSSCATDPQAHLPMLYYACYIRGSVVAAVALMSIHTATSRRDVDKGYASRARVHALKIRAIFTVTATRRPRRSATSARPDRF
ncbi:Uncharacterized protein DBV15_03433 [Temnothorax longispinosus]|uniref:Uncharacterized protein n=1 Tax=Temnothorax longispinosus TaxID=300112 RepID=A0A4S2KE12_9HYME|nr:Uncharacterized protein DBV15_03433 [Temnothorax longispinosus]